MRFGIHTWWRTTYWRRWRSRLISSTSSPVHSTCASSMIAQGTTSRICSCPAAIVELSVAPKTSKWWGSGTWHFLSIRSTAHFNWIWNGYEIMFCMMQQHIVLISLWIVLSIVLGLVMIQVTLISTLYCSFLFILLFISYLLSWLTYDWEGSGIHSTIHSTSLLGRAWFVTILWVPSHS